MAGRFDINVSQERERWNVIIFGCPRVALHQVLNTFLALSSHDHHELIHLGALVVSKARYCDVHFSQSNIIRERGRCHDPYPLAQ